MNFDFDKYATWLEAIPPEEMWRAQKHRMAVEDIETGEGRTQPHIFPPGSGMLRFQACPNGGRSGITKLAPGAGFELFYYYDEHVVGLEGTAHCVLEDRPTGKILVDDDIKVHDLVYIPGGTQVKITNRSAEHFLFLWIALPVQGYAAVERLVQTMRPEDIEGSKAQSLASPGGQIAEFRRSKPKARR